MLHMPVPYVFGSFCQKSHTPLLTTPWKGIPYKSYCVYMYSEDECFVFPFDWIWSSTNGAFMFDGMALQIIHSSRTLVGKETAIDMD